MSRSLPCFLVVPLAYPHPPDNVLYSVALLNHLTWEVLEAGFFPYLLPPTHILKTISGRAKEVVQLAKYLPCKHKDLPGFHPQNPHKKFWARWPELVISALHG